MYALERKYNMKIDKGKAKIVIIGKRERHTRIILACEPLEGVKDFLYLGSKITIDESKREILSKMSQGKNSF